MVAFRANTVAVAQARVLAVGAVAVAAWRRVGARLARVEEEEEEEEERGLTKDLCLENKRRHAS